MTSLLLLFPLLRGEDEEGEEDEDEEEGKVEEGGKRCGPLWMLRAAAISAVSMAPATNADPASL